MAALLWALGCVLCLEGLLFALMPSRLEEALEMLRRLPEGSRRTIGLAALAGGVALLWMARALGA